MGYAQRTPSPPRRIAIDRAGDGISRAPGSGPANDAAQAPTATWELRSGKNRLQWWPMRTSSSTRTEWFASPNPYARPLGRVARAAGSQWRVAARQSPAW